MIMNGSGTASRLSFGQIVGNREYLNKSTIETSFQSSVDNSLVCTRERGGRTAVK